MICVLTKNEDVGDVCKENYDKCVYNPAIFHILYFLVCFLDAGGGKTSCEAVELDVGGDFDDLSQLTVCQSQ